MIIIIYSNKLNQHKVDSDDSSIEEICIDSDSSTDNEGFMNELDHYLGSARVKDIKDPLKWWFDNRGSYPRLSHMARDFLTIPGEFFYISNLEYFISYNIMS